MPQQDKKSQLMGGEEPLTGGLQYVASAVKRSSHRECAVSVSIFKPDMTPTGSLCQDWSQCHPADPSFTSQYLTKPHRMEQVVCHARPQRDGDSQCCWAIEPTEDKQWWPWHQWKMWFFQICEPRVCPWLMMDVAPGHLLSRFDQQEIWLSRLNAGH